MLGILCQMRWTELFRHLEEDFTSGAGEPLKTGDKGASEDSHLLLLCTRAKAIGAIVTVGITTGDVLHMSPRGCGSDWMSGLIGGDTGPGIVIPLASVVWLEGPAMLPGEIATPGTKARWRDVLADMVHRRAAVTVRTSHGDTHGVISSVGVDYIEMAGGATGLAGTVRRIRLAAISFVLSGHAGWG